MPQQSALAPADLDQFGRMFFALLAELWVTRDRAAIMEKLLVNQGVLQPGQIEAFAPSGDFAAELAAMRDQLMSQVMSAPLLADSPKVDDIINWAKVRQPTPAG